MTPYYDDGRVALHVGHVLDVLAELEVGSVQTVVTSPPYWGLRSYGTEAQSWGGDPECPHNLAAAPGKVLTGGNGTASAKQVTNAGSQYGNLWEETHPAGYRSSDTNPGPLQSAGNTNRERFGGYVCSACGAYYGELGSEPTPELFVANLVAVFRAVRRVLRDDGTLWLNLGDSYATSPAGNTGARRIGDGGAIHENKPFVIGKAQGFKPKDLCGIPWRVAFALQADGWYLRSDIIWHKPNPMPESVTDRPTKAHEYLFLLSKRAEYFYDAEAIKEPTPPQMVKMPDGWDTRPGAHGRNGWEGRQHGEANTAVVSGRNRRSVWTIPTEAYPAAHFATFPRKLVEPCLLAGTSARGQCPACGAPWRRVVERERNGASWINPKALETQYGGRGTERLGPGIQDYAETTGWQPGCTCDAGDPIPQVVLDCFAGSGTTLAVARWHQRRAVGIELNPEYARLIEQRLAQGVLL